MGNIVYVYDVSTAFEETRYTRGKRNLISEPVESIIYPGRYSVEHVARIFSAGKNLAKIWSFPPSRYSIEGARARLSFLVAETADIYRG